MAPATAVVAALIEAELQALDEAVLPVTGDFTDPGRTEAAAAACCWFKGKIKAGPC